MASGRKMFSRWCKILQNGVSHPSNLSELILSTTGLETGSALLPQPLSQALSYPHAACRLFTLTF